LTGCRGNPSYVKHKLGCCIVLDVGASLSNAIAFP